MSTASLLVILASVTVTALAQLCLKLASTRYAGPMFGEGFLTSVVSQMLHPLTIVAMIASFALLAVAMRPLPLGTAYTVWTGIGAVGAFVVGIAVLGEAATPMRLAAAALIVSGIVMMKLSSGS